MVGEIPESVTLMTGNEGTARVTEGRLHFDFERPVGNNWIPASKLTPGQLGYSKDGQIIMGCSDNTGVIFNSAKVLTHEEISNERYSVLLFPSGTTIKVKTTN